MSQVVVIETGTQTVVQVTQLPAYVLSVTEATSSVEVLTVGVQGPPGPTGPQGTPGDISLGDASLDGGNF
jgi:hypothetical protein